MKNLQMLVVIILFGLTIFYTCNAQNPLHLGKMQMKYELQNDTLTIHLEAPTKGWLAIGFNKENNIVGSDLIMLRVKNNRVEFEDQYVFAPHVNPTDQIKGGTMDIFNVQGKEVGNRTFISFKRRLITADKLDFQHVAQKNFWLILAYSVSDDFKHHSLMRKHTSFQWI